MCYDSRQRFHLRVGICLIDYIGRYKLDSILLESTLYMYGNKILIAFLIVDLFDSSFSIVVEYSSGIVLEILDDGIFRSVPDLNAPLVP